MTPLEQLSEATASYGKRSVAFFREAKEVGNLIVRELPTFLESGATVFGVPPRGAWEPTDYRDEKFSFHGAPLLTLDPIEMGVAIRIPNVTDEGAFWMRVVLTFRLDDDLMVVEIGDDQSVTTTGADRSALMQVICAEIHRYVLQTLKAPSLIEAEQKRGRIGFGIY